MSGEIVFDNPGLTPLLITGVGSLAAGTAGVYIYAHNDVSRMAEDDAETDISALNEQSARESEQQSTSYSQIIRT